MGNVRGFIDTNRKLPKAEPPKVRIQHFNEFIEKTETTEISNQASRCMDCGVPFCHSACPLGNLIPEFNDAVYKENWKQAYELLIETNNFPEFTGRICPAPCEASCVLSINNEAVTIEHIEKSIIEKAFDEGWIEKFKPVRNGHKVAIIGSGPAGLSCADQLNKYGFTVTVFEKNLKPGGLLRYGIPDYKLEKNVIDRRIKLLQEEGIVFKCGISIGEDITLGEIEKEYDRIVLCVGAEKSRDLNIPGRHFKNIDFAMDFLTHCNKSNDPDFIEHHEDFRGKTIVVIGGGDTGSDCIGNSHRLGAKNVIQLELLGKPTSARSQNNPWPQWPMTLKTSTSHEEGGERQWAIQTKKFLSDDGVLVSGLEVVDVSWEKVGDTYSFIELEGTSRIISCDKIFLAVGFEHLTHGGFISNFEKDAKGNLETTNYKTSRENIFAAGDARRGQSLVVWAIQEGRSCAEAVVKSFTI